jgi:ketosteroid isomerase-like protein
MEKPMAAPATMQKNEVLELEKKYWEASKGPDKNTLEKLTADQFTMVMKDGINTMSRKEFLDMGADIKLKSYRLDDNSATFRELAPGVVAIAYKAHADFEQAGKPLPTDAYYTSVWQKQAGGWQCALSSETRIEPGR